MILVLPNCNLPSTELRKWNQIIKKQMLGGEPKKAILSYIEMQVLGFKADNFTFPIILKAASAWCTSDVGFAIHGQAIKSEFASHVFVQTALLGMYGEFGFVDDVRKVFDKMLVRDVVAWNAMLDVFVGNGMIHDAAGLFSLMPVKDLSSFNIMISGYSSCGEIGLARSMFDAMSERDVVSWNSMIVGYARSGVMEKAFTLFREVPKRDIVTWNSMISGCLRNQLYAEAFDLFGEMKNGDCICRPDYLTVTSVLSACAGLGSLEKGVEVHVYAIDNELDSSPHVITALIDMYANCGSIELSLQIFYKSWVKDIYCWNAMISSLALHGHGHAALKLFGGMREAQIRPDDITFVGLLTACSHSGLVHEGCKLFSHLDKEFGLSPKLEHYGCMIDLLSRARHLDLAFEFIEAMPFEPGESILGALLSACVNYQDLDNGEKAMKLISSRKAQLSDGEFMMFSNLYASCGYWEEANRWRDMMDDAGVVKTAGCSEIEIEGRFQRFLAGEQKQTLDFLC